MYTYSRYARCPRLRFPVCRRAVAHALCASVDGDGAARAKLNRSTAASSLARSPFEGSLLVPFANVNDGSSACARAASSNLET
ncbi:hypothetical protein PybrP1_006922 [[Pythium] brassicae (nom. inval.)]|nr:hypothetical protein PybrP1_006922 [[Pythium] brassicae (nom. inval.)]